MVNERLRLVHFASLWLEATRNVGVHNQFSVLGITLNVRRSVRTSRQLVFVKKICECRKWSINFWKHVACLFLVWQPPVGHGLLIHDVSRSHTTTHHRRYDSSGRMISSSQRPLPDNTQQSQHTSMPSVGFEPRQAAARTGYVACTCQY